MVKLASIQLSAKPMDMAGNYAKAEDYIRRAAKEGARLAVIPEYYITSWCPEHPEFAEAFKRENKYLQKFCVWYLNSWK
jgi:predicted amidohydrolase